MSQKLQHQQPAANRWFSGAFAWALCAAPPCIICKWDFSTSRHWAAVPSKQFCRSKWMPCRRQAKTSSARFICGVCLLIFGAVYIIFAPLPTAHQKRTPKKLRTLAHKLFQFVHICLHVRVFGSCAPRHKVTHQMWIMYACSVCAIVSASCRCCCWRCSLNLFAKQILWFNTFRRSWRECCVRHPWYGRRCVEHEQF